MATGTKSPLLTEDRHEHLSRTTSTLDTGESDLVRHAMRKTDPGLEIRNLVKTRVPKAEFNGYPPPRTPTYFRRLFAVIRAYTDNLHIGRFIYRPGLN